MLASYDGRRILDPSVHYSCMMRRYDGWALFRVMSDMARWLNERCARWQVRVVSGRPLHYCQQPAATFPPGGLAYALLLWLLLSQPTGGKIYSTVHDGVGNITTTRRQLLFAWFHAWDCFLHLLLSSLASPFFLLNLSSLFSLSHTSFFLCSLIPYIIYICSYSSWCQMIRHLILFSTLVIVPQNEIAITFNSFGDHNHFPPHCGGCPQWYLSSALD